MWVDIVTIGGAVTILGLMYYYLRVRKNQDSPESYYDNLNIIKLVGSTTQFGFHFQRTNRNGWIKLTEHQHCPTSGDVLIEFKNGTIRLSQFNNSTNNYELQNIQADSSVNNNTIKYHQLEMNNGTVSIHELLENSEKLIFEGTCGVTKSNRMIGPFNFLEFSSNILNIPKE